MAKNPRTCPHIPGYAQEVSREDFFRRMAKEDVAPHIMNLPYSPEYGYVREWKLRTGYVIGYSHDVSEYRRCFFKETSIFYLK